MEKRAIINENQQKNIIFIAQFAFFSIKNFIFAPLSNK